MYYFIDSYFITGMVAANIAMIKEVLRLTHN